MPTKEEIAVGPESAGLLMTPEEFDGIAESDDNYCYELINGVLVVSPIPLPEETGPNELLGHLLLNYKEQHPSGAALDSTLPQQYVRIGGQRRLADRLIWTGLGRPAKPRHDTPSIGIEFVSAGKKNRRRDYQDKRLEYKEAGLTEYWIVDRFRRALTVIHYRPSGEEEQVISENETDQTPLLPGFQVPVGRLLAAADQWAQED